jgi:long-chain acyl-CoA synthetase
MCLMVDLPNTGTMIFTSKSGFEGKVTPEELIDFCKQRMANYKYPRHIEILEELPKTPTGKFLRRELRDKARQ